MEQPHLERRERGLWGAPPGSSSVWYGCARPRRRSVLQWPRSALPFAPRSSAMCDAPPSQRRSQRIPPSDPCAAHIAAAVGPVEHAMSRYYATSAQRSPHLGRVWVMSVGTPS
jgi:hypothetical protein